MGCLYKYVVAVHTIHIYTSSSVLNMHICVRLQQHRYMLCTMNAAVHTHIYSTYYVHTMYHDIGSTVIMLRQFDQ